MRKTLNAFRCYFFLFINEFNFYHNIYKSLMRIYIQIIIFKFYKRIRRINVFSLIFNFHDNNFNNVINSLHNFRFLNKKLIFELSQFTRICVFTLYFFKNIL